MSLYTQVCAWDSRQSGHWWPEGMARGDIGFEYVRLAFTLIFWNLYPFQFSFHLGAEVGWSISTANLSLLILRNPFIFSSINTGSSLNQALWSIPAPVNQAEDIALELLQKQRSCLCPIWASEAGCNWLPSSVQTRQTEVTAWVSNNLNQAQQCRYPQWATSVLPCAGSQQLAVTLLEDMEVLFTALSPLHTRLKGTLYRKPDEGPSLTVCHQRHLS